MAAVRYVTEFTFPDAEQEWDVLYRDKRTCVNSRYPFGVLSGIGLTRLTLDPVTILYGGNGSGKTTALNVMAERLSLIRMAPFNRSDFFERYTALCGWEGRKPVPAHSRIITSDDVFDFMLDLRALNQGLERDREALYSEWTRARENPAQLRSLDDYEALRRTVEARRRTYSSFAREELPAAPREHSNGESAFLYFTGKLEEGGLYLLDEPENSLSPGKQTELADFIADSVRFFRCQVVMATHSPFLLAIPGARVWDLDSRPPRPRRWTELDNVRVYRDFFERHRADFGDGGAGPGTI